MSFNNDGVQSQKWWNGLTDEQKFTILDKTAIWYRERNLLVLRENNIKYLWRSYSGEFENI